MVQSSTEDSMKGAPCDSASVNKAVCSGILLSYWAMHQGDSRLCANQCKAYLLGHAIWELSLAFSARAPAWRRAWGQQGLSQDFLCERCGPIGALLLSASTALLWVLPHTHRKYPSSAGCRMYPLEGQRLETVCMYITI